MKNDKTETVNIEEAAISAEEPVTTVPVVTKEVTFTDNDAETGERLTAEAMSFEHHEDPYNVVSNDLAAYYVSRYEAAGVQQPRQFAWLKTYALLSNPKFLAQLREGEKKKLAMNARDLLEPVIEAYAEIYEMLGTANYGGRAVAMEMVSSATYSVAKHMMGQGVEEMIQLATQYKHLVIDRLNDQTAVNAGRWRGVRRNGGYDDE